MLKMVSYPDIMKNDNTDKIACGVTTSYVVCYSVVCFYFAKTSSVQNWCAVKLSFGYATWSNVQCFIGLPKELKCNWTNFSHSWFIIEAFTLEQLNSYSTSPQLISFCVAGTTECHSLHKIIISWFISVLYCEELQLRQCRVIVQNVKLNYVLCKSHSKHFCHILWFSNCIMDCRSKITI